ncbi:MAG: MFS transporter [Anaerolineales bacterium]|nr:MFS transporter [Anaerolineales bacterium]
MFGLATVVFGISRSFWLTFAFLAVTGATDMISMVVRNTARQLQTPDEMRGRMVSLNMIFFQGGPQLGEFQAGEPWPTGWALRPRSCWAGWGAFWPPSGSPLRRRNCGNITGKISPKKKLHKTSSNPPPSSADVRFLIQFV